MMKHEQPNFEQLMDLVKAIGVKHNSRKRPETCKGCRGKDDKK